MATAKQLANLAKARAARKKKAGKKVKAKAPSKRTKSRRAKPQIKGYSANPSTNIGKGFIIGITDESKKGSPVIGYFTGKGFDDDHHKAMFCPTIDTAKIIATEARKYMPKKGYKLAAVDYPLKK